MTILLKSTVTGTYKGKPVSFEITFPNVSPSDAFDAAYMHLTGKHIYTRRRDWAGQSASEGTYSLRGWNKAGHIEMDLTISRPVKADQESAK